jgi:hypothetical protein
VIYQATIDANKFMFDRSIMRTPHRLIFGIIALSVGIFLAGISIFESPEVFMALNLPRAAANNVAFVGMGAIGLGLWQLMPLFMNWQNARNNLLSWAEWDRDQSLLIGLGCISIGSILFLSMIWATIDAASMENPIATKVKSILLALLTGGLLVFFGGTLVKMSGSNKTR